MQPMHTDIQHFEQHSGFYAVREKILKSEEGHMSLVLEISNHTAPDGQVIKVKKTAKYYWKKVRRTGKYFSLMIIDIQD